MVAAATTALPERADTGRDYDYRYAWIRDQCFAGQAAAAVGAHDLLDAAVSFVSARVLADRTRLRPAYTVLGGPVPGERALPVPGYPGARGGAGNHARTQFQLDTFGEALLLLATAAAVDRLDDDGRHAIEVLIKAIDERGHEPDAGIWELEPRRWAHSRLMCAAGLRAVATHLQERRGKAAPGRCVDKANALVADVDRDCLHPSGRWQRSPNDPGVDTALLLSGIRGAVPISDPRFVHTLDAVRNDLSEDGYLYRFRHDQHRSLHDAEGAFVLSGFHMAMATSLLGRDTEAARWFERTRGALGPPGLFAEEFDVVQRQFRGNLPQAFVHAATLEAGHLLAQGGIDVAGFGACAR
jgi:GH15 family glucan-1,4-alpha-glucosidase